MSPRKPMIDYRTFRFSKLKNDVLRLDAQTRERNFSFLTIRTSLLRQMTLLLPMPRAQLPLQALWVAQRIPFFPRQKALSLR